MMESKKRTRISEAANPRKEKDANMYLYEYLLFEEMCDQTR